MISVEESVEALAARLPELAWKLDVIHPIINSKLLPRGLFNPSFEMTSTSCIEEIKEDLGLLSRQQTERGRYFLATRINQKINVLVRLCQISSEKSLAKVPQNFSVQAINTRQQWLETLQQDIEKLSVQQQALSHRMQQLKDKQDPQALLQLQAEVGEIERRLTLAKETLIRATAMI